MVVAVAGLLSAALAFSRPTKYEAVSTIALTPSESNGGFVTRKRSTPCSGPTRRPRSPASSSTRLAS